MFASDLKILTVSATTIPTTVINNKSPIMVTAQETLEYSSCFQGDSFKGRRQQSYEHQHQGKQQQSTKTKFSHNSNKFQTQHQQKYHNYSSNSSTNNHNNKSRKKHYNNNINSTSMNHKKYYHQQQQTPQQLHYEQHQHQYHLATKSGANNKNNNSNNNNCLIKNQNYTAVDLLIHTNNNRNGSQPELSSSTIASCSQSTSTDQQQTIIYEQKEAKQVPLKTSQTANSLSAVLITTTTTASSTHTRASCISCWTNLTKLSPQTPLANLKNNKSALYQQQQKSSNFHTRSIAFSSTNSGSNLQDFVAVALAATAASKCSFNASQNSSAKTSHQYASNGSTGTSKRKSFWKSSTVVGSGGGGSAGAGATANSTQSPKQKKTIVGALDKASLQENTFQTQHIGNKSNSQKGRGGVSTNQHQFVVVEKSAMTTALAGGTTVSAVSTPTTTTATSAITERHTSTSVITPAIAGAPAPNLSNSSSNSSLSTSAFIADSQFTQEQVKQGGRQSPEGNVLSGNTTIDNNSLNLKNSGVISAENFIPTTTTATPRSSSASSSPGSGASSSNSYTLDFLHSVGVQMTGGANLAALKANNNMSNMRSSSLTGSTTTLYSNHTVGASPVRNSYTFAAMAASQHQQHYMFGGGGTGNGNGTATSSGHHYHQSHHHHPPQLTVASFLQKDLLGETLLSSSTAAAANNSGGPGGGININNFIDHAAAQHAPHYQPPAQGHRYHHGYYHHPSHYQVQQQQLQPPSSTPPPPPPPPPPTPQQQQQQQPPLSTSQHISFTTIPHSLSGGYAAPLTGELARIVANGNQHAYQGYYAANHSNLISQPHGRQQQQHSSSNNNNTNYNVGLQAAKKSPTYGSSSASSCSSSSTSSISSNCSNTPASSSMSVTSSSAPNHSSKLHDNNNGSGPTLMLSFNSANTNNYAQRYHQRGQHQQPHYQNQQSNIINNKKLLTPLSLTMSPLLPTPSPTNTICYVQLDELSTAVKTPISSSLPSNDISTPSRTHSNKLISTAVGNDYDSDTSSTKSSAVSGQGPQVKYQPLKSLSLSSSSSSSAASSISLSTPGTIDCSQTSTPAPSATPLLSPLDYNAYNSVLQTIPPSTTVHHNPQQHYQAQYQTHMLTYSRNVPTPASNQLNAQQLYRNGVISLLNLQTQNNGGMNSGIHTISQEDDYVQALQQQQQLAHHFYFSANSPSTGCDQATLGVTSALTASLTTSGGSGYWNPTQQANLLYNQTTNVSISPCLNDLDEFQTNSFSINQAMPSLSSSIGGGIYINNSTSNVHPKRGGSTQILSQQQQQHLIVQQQQQSSISLPGSSSTSITSLNTGMRIRTVGCNQQIQTSVITSAGNGSQQSPPAPAMQTHLFAHQPAPLQTVPQPSHNLIYSNPPTHMRTLTGATTNPSVHEFFTHTPPDRFLARAHLIEAKEAPPALLSNTKWDHLSQGIWKKFISSQQTEETFKQKMRLWRYLYLLIKNAYPRYGLYLVGSTISGFGADSSDVDMCLVSRSPSTIDPRMESLFNLTVLRDCLSKSGEFENFNLIEAKVPILRFRERIHQLEVDLNFNNCVGIKNTHLLYCYSQLDWRLRPLVLVIKLWAQYHNINNAKHMTISSYSLVLMVIHFLQYAVNPAVLPCLHDIYPDKFTLLRSNDFGYVDMNETIGHYESKNAQTLGELFLYFLEYYSCFDYAQFAISVRTGGLLPINVCRTAKSLKNDMHQWKELCIEEPFDLTNTARSVYDFETFERVKAVFVTSWRLLQQTLDLNSVFSTVIPSLQTNNKEDYEQQHIPTKSVLKEITLAATTTTVATMTYDNYCVLKNNNASLVTTGEVHNKDLSNYTSVQKQINSSTSTNSANNNANVANSTTSNSNLTTLIS
uniref:PAP-associated domain-containing protein n=1 Tax=Glossina brevipalpis TaxID=37001 RepID=A0A1A9W310_9MUSC